MKNQIRIIVATLLLTFPTGFALAADVTGYNKNQGVYTGSGTTTYQQPEGYPATNFPAGGNRSTNLNIPSDMNAPSGMNAPSNMNIPTGMSPSELRTYINQGGKAQTNQLSGTANQQAITQQQSVLTLNAEPGDTLVSLSWTVTGINQIPADQQLLFAVFYGIEPGLYDKKVEVGSVTDYKLRNLTNNQVYFVKIQGYTKDGTISLISEEGQVTPLATESLGSSLEQAFARKNLTLQDKIEADPFSRQLKQFGYDFFKNSLATGVPTDNLPVGGDYVIGPGDTVHIDMWGSVDNSYDLQADRNGEITIPKIGVLKVWGLTYDQAKEVINRAIAHYYKGYELNVTLGKLRTIQVFVVGEVVSPGTYALGSLGTVINALSLAGGPSKSGSLRSVRVLRGRKAVQEIDLYDMFLSGDRSKDVRLENGDTVYVSVIGPTVAVAGEVKRPAIYELKGTTSLQQILQMAGGITAAGYGGRLQVERFEKNASRVVLDYQLQGGAGEASPQEIHDRDMVKVFPVNKALRQVVTLKGNVVRPGEYQFHKGMKLTDVIPDYGAILPESYLVSVEITRLSLPDFHKEILTVNLGGALDGDAKENVLLQEQDTIKVFTRREKEQWRSVSISGQVLRPGSYDYYPNMTVRDLVTLAGSPMDSAYLESGELTSVVFNGKNASTIRREINLRKALNGDPSDNLVLRSDDALIVRGVEGWLEAKDRFVTLKGEVLFPGDYAIAKGERLSSLIERAGGFTDKAYLPGAAFTRESVREDQQKRMDDVVDRTEKDIIRKQSELASVSSSKEELEATKAALAGLQQNLVKLRKAKAQGRVVIHLAPLGYFRGTPYDLPLQGGDVLTVPQTSSVVNVMGSVYNPTSLVFMPDKSMEYYLQKSGGPLPDADSDAMYVIKADGSVFSKQQAGSFGLRWDDDSRHWTFGGFLSRPLEPGDTLVVPEQLERTAWMRDFKEITTIISQIALTAGVVLVGLK